MFWIGSYWREDEDDNQALQASTSAMVRGTVHPSAHSIIASVVATLAVVAIWPLYSNFIEKAAMNPNPAQLESFRGQWQEVAPFNTWKPDFNPANAQLTRYFEQDQKNVGINILYYRNQRQGASLITSSNRIVNDKDAIWRKVDASSSVESIANKSLSVQETVLHSPLGSMLVWKWYWIDGKFTASDYVGKLLQAKEKLLMHGDDGAALLVFAPYTTNPEEARDVMRRFVADNAAALESTLTQNKKQ
jgi:EpsI family protein